MKKLNNKGFTLVETLCAVLLLVIVTYMMTTGMQFAVKNFSKNTAVSEAQILSKTLSTAVGDELRYAKNPQKDTELDIVRFTSATFGNDDGGNGLYFNVRDGRVYLGEYKFISDASYTMGNKAALSIDYDEEKKQFSVELKITDSDGNILRENNFDVISLNDD